jgi:hypothetical protein
MAMQAVSVHGGTATDAHDMQSVSLQIKKLNVTNLKLQQAIYYLSVFNKYQKHKMVID